MSEEKIMTPIPKTQLAGKISEMLPKKTDKSSERLEILRAVINFTIGSHVLWVYKDDLLKKF